MMEDVRALIEWVRPNDLSRGCDEGVQRWGFGFRFKFLSDRFLEAPQIGVSVLGSESPGVPL